MTLEELDQAVKIALDYQKTHPDTLVIVTGDHAHSTQIVMDNVTAAARPRRSRPSTATR